jgi:murein DD-endopeptidase MepM/ murein hydrolase activator NlpD
MSQTWKLALPLAVILLSGCMPESPRTVFNWGVNDRLHRPVATAAKTTSYKVKDARTADGQPIAITPKAAPTRAVVTSQALAPVGSASQPAPASGAPLFAWPVNGPLLSDFGSTANGGKNDGINIAANKDTPIRASASGTVTYAGDELKNYGNLVLVKHAGGYTTAYAHADRLIVARGDVVSRGEIIGYVGQTGDVSKPQLHFEIRSATTPVNPHSYLAATTASADPR